MASFKELAPSRLAATTQVREQLLARGRSFQHLSLIMTYVILGSAGLIILLPFFWLISASLKTDLQFYAIPIQWIPSPAVWKNYLTVFTSYHIGTYIVNSIWLAVLSVAAEVSSSAIVAYGFARFRFAGRNALFLILLATLMIPSQVLTISLYSIFRDLGWIDTFLPIIVPKFFGSAFLIFLFRQFFLGLPRELDEAAKIDGAGTFRVFWQIILPQSRPVIVVAMIFSFLGSWRDTWGPLIYLNSDSNRTLPIGLLYFTSQTGPVYPLLMAATVLALAVPDNAQAPGQRYINSGIAIVDVR